MLVNEKAMVVSADVPATNGMIQRPSSTGDGTGDVGTGEIHIDPAKGNSFHKRWVIFSVKLLPVIQ